MGNQLTVKRAGMSQAEVLALIAANAAPLAHKTQHQAAGSDTITVQGLAGVLTAEQLSSWAGVSGKPTTFTPAAHNTSHQLNGGDALSVQGLAGVLTAEQLSSWAGVSGKPSEFAPGAGEGHISVALPYPDSTPQGNWIFTLAGSDYKNGYIYNGANTQGDNCIYLIYLAAGTYTLRAIARTNTNRGITKILLNTTQVAAFDLYTASDQSSKFFAQTGIVVATSALYSLKLLSDTKNAASSGYYITYQDIVLYRTA